MDEADQPFEQQPILGSQEVREAPPSEPVKACTAALLPRFDLKYDQAPVPEQATGMALQLFKETRVGF